MAFNLNAAGLALADTYDLHLKNPASDELLFDDEAKAVTITLYGKSSPRYRNQVTAMQNRELKRKHKKEIATAEQIQDESTALLVACSADSTLEIDGIPVNDKESFKKLYSAPAYSWIRDQVDAALGDDSNFLGK